jgi:hypothetical protein
LRDEGAVANRFGRHWRWWVLAFWIATAALLLRDKWTAIGWFALGDTDDNLRMVQVRALIAGQDWFDLRQYKLAPPDGASVHWSRIVDLPIAGIMLGLKPFMTGAVAEKVAVATAPLLPMLLSFFAIGAALRRLISPNAFALAIGLLITAHSARGQWVPLRIDHHGWQLFALSLLILAFAVRRPRIGGLLLGLATALSLSIGLEMLLYFAAAGAAAVLMWVQDREQAPRLAAYGVGLGGGSALGYLLFASYDNRLPVCDALSPVWLSVVLAGGAVALVLSRLKVERWPVRLACAVAGGAIVAALYALAWPHCLGRLEGVSPELDQLWLSRVREALPIYKHDRGVVAAVLSLPVAGLIGYALALWRTGKDPAQMAPWAALGLLSLIATALLFWQTRAGPAAQMLSIPGATALAWFAIAWAQRQEALIVRVSATLVSFFVISGLAVQNIVGLIPKEQKPNVQVAQANNKCPTLAALKPIALQKPGIIFTHVDLGPRLITVTPHKAVAGPYHRNQQAILDVMRGFRGSVENAREIITRRRIDYVLICPGLSETTIYSAEAPNGFYRQINSGKVPAWMQPVQLPKDWPYKMWRVVNVETAPAARAPSSPRA